MGGARTLDQAVHGLGDPLSGGFGSGDHDCQTGGTHAMWDSRPAGACCARSGARAGETREGSRWAQVHKRLVRTELSAVVIEK